MTRLARLAAFIAPVLWLATASSASAADSYGFDKDYTKILFVYNHLGMSNQYGRFTDYDGTIVFDQENPENSKVEVTVKAASIETDVPVLNDELRGEQFFAVTKFPDITFVSDEVRQTGKTRGQVTGTLTIKGNSKPVTLDVTFNYAGEHPLGPYVETYKGKQMATFSAEATLLRSDFGVERFAPLTSDRVQVIIETELWKQ